MIWAYTQPLGTDQDDTIGTPSVPRYAAIAHAVTGPRIRAAAQRAARHAIMDPLGQTHNSPLGIAVRHAIQREWLKALQGQARRVRAKIVRVQDANALYPAGQFPTPRSYQEKTIDRNRRWANWLNLQLREIQAAGVQPVGPVAALEAAEQVAGMNGTLSGLGQTLTEFGQSLPIACQVQPWTSDAPGLPGGPAGGSGGGGGGGGGGSPISKNAPASSASTGFVQGAAASLFSSDTAGLGESPLATLALTAAPAVQHAASSSYHSTTPPPPQGGDGGDTGAYDDEEMGYVSTEFDEPGEFGSWLSKFIGRNKNTLAKLAGPVAAGTSLIPVLGPIISSAIGAVGVAAGAKVEAEALRRAQAQAAALQPAAAPTVVVQPSTPAPKPARAPARSQTPPWLIPAALIGGALMLGSRR